MQIDSFHYGGEAAWFIFPVERGSFMVDVYDAAFFKKYGEAAGSADVVGQVMKHGVTCD